MRSGLVRTGKILPCLFLIAAVGSLRGQRMEFFQPQLPELEEKAAEMRQSLPLKKSETVPLEGKIDRGKYILGPGDEVDVSIWGGEKYSSFQLIISAEGRILVPPVGPMDIAGMTLAQGEEYVSGKLSLYYSESRVSLTLINPRRFRIFAVGAVSMPGTYIVTAVDRLSDLIMIAGGIKRGGSWRRIRIFDREKVLQAEVDLLRHEVTGDLSTNPLLTDGGIVEVPTIQDYIILRGRFANMLDRDTILVGLGQKEVINEYNVEFLPGESLKDLLDLVGEPQTPERPDSFLITVRKPGTTDALYLPFDDALLGQKLERGTTYEFPTSKNWVYLTGNVNRPGRYVYQPGWTVHEYLGQSGGPNWLGSSGTCFLRRLDGTRFKSKSTDKVLPGDELYVPEKFQLYRLYPVIAGVASASIYVLFRH
jgi:protein involved in polysaccharide export with SLBB domain